MERNFIKFEKILYTTIAFYKITTHTKTLNPPLTSSQSRATKWAEAELGLHRAVTEPAPQEFGDGRLGSRWRRRQRVGPREEEVAIFAVHNRLFPWPPPYRNEEQLQNLFVLHQIGRRAARYAPARTIFQHLPDLLLYSSHKEEEHFLSFLLALDDSGFIAVALPGGFGPFLQTCAVGYSGTSIIFLFFSNFSICSRSSVC